MYCNDKKTAVVWHGCYREKDSIPGLFFSLSDWLFIRYLPMQIHRVNESFCNLHAYPHPYS
jgi:hypothetical protein